jgi:phage head maturation protease
MTPVPDTESEVPVDVERARTTEESGGGGNTPRKYNRDPEGTSTGGQFTANPSGAKTQKPTPKQPVKPKPRDYKPIVPVATKKGPMKLGGDNDPQQVKQLQALLGALGLGKPPTNGSFDGATEEAVKEAQRRLGLKPTGRASTSLLNKLTSAYSLSPCIKRSADEEREFEIFRSAVAAGDFDDPEEDSEGRPLVNDIERCCPDVYDDENHVFRREWDLDGIDIIRGGQGGDGRTVEAYATVFDKPTEINDQHGHYLETIHRAAFDEALRGGIGRVSCYYNHGMDIHGKPSDTFSIPIGAPIEVKPDGRGLKTITRFNDGPVEDRILEAIRNQAIRAYSFRGPIRKSDPPRVRKVRSGEALPTVTRMALGLTEYGPTPAPYYADAGILAVRSRLASLDEEKWDRLFRLLAASTPEDQEAVRTALSATPDVEGPGAEDQPDEALRSAITQADVRRKIAVWKITGGVTS